MSFKFGNFPALLLFFISKHEFLLMGLRRRIGAQIIGLKLEAFVERYCGEICVYFTHLETGSSETGLALLGWNRGQLRVTLT